MNDAVDWITRHREFWEGTLDNLEHFLEQLDGGE